MRVDCHNRGATILETSIVLVVIAILVSGAGTALYSTMADVRDRAVLNQLEGLKKAIVGEPRTIQPGERIAARLGYLGDMGSLPPVLSSLETAGAQPDYAVDSLLQLGVGWRGPYVSPTVSSGLVDPWGSGLVYVTAAGTSSVTGATTVASIRSLGPDLQNGTADDHVVEVYKSEAFTKVNGFVKDGLGATVPGISVTISYPTNGAITSPSTVTDNDGLYSFDNVPHGSQLVQLAPKLAYQHGTGLTTGGNRNNLQFVVENLAKTSTSITTIKLTWVTSPASDFKRLLVNGVQVYNATAPSGTTISFSSQSLAGTGVIQEPFRIDVSNLVMLVPDAIIGTVGTGGSVKFEVEDFEEVGDTPDVDVTGVTFTAEFSDGSKTVFSPLRK